MTDQALRRQIAKIAKSLVNQGSRISTIERAAQAKYVSITDGSTTYYDTEGNPVVTVGRQPDGTYTSIDQNGVALLAPSAPVLSSEPGILTIMWDGRDKFGGALWPANFDHIEVHVSVVDEPATDVTEVATFHGTKGGTLTLSLSPDEYFVKLVAVNTSGIESVATAAVTQTVAPLPEPGIQAYRQDAAPTGLGLDDFGSMWYDTNDDNRQYFWDGANWVEVTNTSLATIDYVDDVVILSASGKNKTTYSLSLPGSTANTAGDIWFQYNGSNQVIGQWRGAGGTSWVQVTLENSVIATLDAAKINTGFLDVANRIQAGSIVIGKVSNLQSNLDAKVSTFTTTGGSPTTPTALTAGDLWIHTNAGITKIYRATATGTGSWVLVSDDSATPTTFVQSATPTSLLTGDIWINTTDGKMYRAFAAGVSTIGGSAWILINDPTTSGNKSFAQGTVPTSTAVGDIWVNTSDSNKIYTANAVGVSTIVTSGNGWYLRTDLTAKTKTFLQGTIPTSVAAGDAWVNTADNNKLYIAFAAGVSTIGGAAWVLVQDSAGAAAAASTAQTAANTAIANANTAQTTADAKASTYFQTSSPWANGATGHALDEGDLWVDTDDSNKLYRWVDSTKLWTLSDDQRIALAVTAASNAQTTANSKITTFYQTSAPTATTIGDLWVDTDDSNKLYRATALGSGSWVLIQDAVGQATTARVGAVSDLKTLWGHPNDTTLIDGGDVYTNSIRARSLLLMDVNNYLSDPGIIDASTSSWILNAGSSIVVSSGSTLGYMELNAGTASTNLYAGDASFWATEAGTEYSISAEYAGVGTNSGATSFSPALQVQDNGTTTLTYLTPAVPISATTSTTWVPFSFSGVIPANGAKFRWQPFINGATIGNKVRIRNIKIRRKNAGSLIVDGSIEAGKLGVNSVVANNIIGGEITGDKLSTNSLNSKTIVGAIIRTAAEGARLELTSTGLIQLDSLNNVILSIGDQNKFTGEVDATSMIIRDSLQLFGKNNLFGAGSKVTLKASAATPSVPPTVSYDYEEFAGTISPSAFTTTGVSTDAGGANIHGTESFFQYARTFTPSGKWEFPIITVDGIARAEFRPTSMVRVARPDNTLRTVMLGEDWTHLNGGFPEIWVRVYDTSTLVPGGGTPPVLKASYKFGNFSYLSQSKVIRLINGTTFKSYWGIIEMNAPLGGGTQSITHFAYSIANTDVVTYVGSQALGAVIPESEILAGGVYSEPAASLGLDGPTRSVIVIQTDKMNYVWNQNALAMEPASYWPATYNTQSRTWVSGSVTANTVSEFYAYNNATSTAQKVFKYANNHKQADATLWAAYAWRGDATQSFQTPMSTQATIAYRKMARLKVTMPALPAPAAGVGAARDPAKDVYGWVYFLGQGASIPIRTAMYAPAVQPTLVASTPLVDTSITLSTYPVFTGTNPVATSTFPASAPATIESDNGMLVITGDGTITAATVNGATLGDTGWVTATLNTGASWGNFGTGFTVARYRRINNIVYLQGLVRLGTGLILTLPSGYRPTGGTLLFAVGTDAGIGRVDIDTSGGVTQISGSNAYVSLNGIQFPAN